MSKKIEVQYMTRPEIKEHIENNGRAILPIGSTEQHSPHLPLGTDTMKLAFKFKPNFNHKQLEIVKKLSWYCSKLYNTVNYTTLNSSCTV